MTHKIYHSLIAALIGAATTGAVQAAPIPAMGLRFVAAEASDSSISVRSARVLPHERSMIVSMCIRVDRDLKGTESIELRPVLTDSTGHSAVLPSIFINGRTQHIAFQRDRRNAKRDLVTLRRRNGMEQTIDYLREVAYQPWMRKATLVLEEVACGCGIPIAYDSHAVATLRSDDTPRLAFRIPEVEEVKTRQESGRAFLAFQLGKSEILDNFRSNATELAKIMQAIDLVRNDSNVTVSHIAIHGYASPDGSLALNERLSAERTQALKSWVMSKYQFDEALFTTAHTAEDWEGLVNFLRNNNTLEGREEILNIIATVGDLDKREARIREEFPSQYRFMLDNWYPFLRHSDYTVGYIVRPFTVEEAKRELKLHPQNLSIDEMFRIAQTYKEGSKEYNEVFLIAVKQNPDHPVANAPTAAGKIGNDQSLLTTVAKGKSIMSVIGTEGLTMSNRGGSAQNVRVSTDSVTHIDIALERAVAKVEIGKRYGSYELKDKSGKVYAKVTPGSFYFVNLSRDYYLFRHTGKFDKNSTPNRDQYTWSLDNYTDIPDTDGYLIDPHFFDKQWDTSNAFDGSTIFDNALTEIVRTGREYEATLFPEAGSYSKSYILENANFWTAQREGYTTGVIIKGILTPEKSRCFDEHGNNIDPQGVHCLYYFNYNFYTSLAAVKAVGGGNIPSGDISARELETQYNIKYFPIDDKSLYACYYKHFIKHLDNGEKRKLGVMEYGVVRNNWYRVTIADIAGLGSGSINIEPTRPVEEDDILLTDYYVSPWQFRPDDTVLSQPRKK